MSLRADRRARVPFALAGVVLLLSSAAYTGTLATQSPIQDRTSTERALATSTTAAHAALEQAAIEASTVAGETVIVAPADTPFGRVLRGPDPFERYLRLLVYRHARQRLAAVSATAGDTTVRPSLPQIRTPDSARRAIARTTIEPVDRGERLRVTIRNVSFHATRGGERTASTQSTLSAVVASPILALHRRTSTYDRRLNNGPLAGPGLGRRLTAGLTLTAQTRGLAQYAGAPIANVLPNRHVELQTNLAAVTLQQDAFGRTDPASVGALGWATARVGLRDGAAAVSGSQDRWSERVLDQPAVATPSAARDVLAPVANQSPRPRVDGDSVAARALVSVLDGQPSAVDTAVREAYTIDARLLTSEHHRSRSTTTRGERPDRGILVSESTTTSHDIEPAPSGDLTAPTGFTLVETAGRRVTTTRRTTRVWQTATGTTRTIETTTTVTAVALGVATRYAPDSAPERPVALSSGRRRLDSAAADALLGNAATRDALAERAATGTLDDRGVRRIGVEPPDSVRRAARRAVLAVHARTRALSAATNRSGTTIPAGPRGLSAALAANRPQLLSAPDRYVGPAELAQTAARRAYLDAAATQLDTDHRRAAQLDSALSGVLAKRNLTVPDPDLQGLPGRRDTGFSVNVTPAYLPVKKVRPRSTPVDQAYHPLAARNVNLFALPSGDAADAVSSTLLPERTRRVDLAIAARTLEAATREAIPRNESLERSRHNLRMQVRSATGHLRATQVRTVARRTPLSPAASKHVVDSVYARYPTVASRALAATNGSIGRDIAHRVTARTGDAPGLLAARLRVAVDDARTETDARVPEDPVHTTGTQVRAVARRGLRTLVQAGIETEAERLKRRALSKQLAAVPAGLPIAPIPGAWYLTVNVWVVEVRGAYERVAVRSVVASPSFGPDGLAYVRESTQVVLDVDGDGSLERLGRVEPVAFDVQTAVIVAVPPGPRGVGDTGGDMDERSPGWPGPPVATGAADGTARNRTETTSPSTGSV